LCKAAQASFTQAPISATQQPNRERYILTSQTVFIVTASLLFLSDKFSFDPEHNAWVLAYLAFAKGAYLVVLFPWIQKGGRNLFNRIEARRAANRRGKGNGPGGVTERTPLVRRKTGDRAVDEANQFDVRGPPWGV
jgi:hypothetical protein